MPLSHPGNTRPCPRWCADSEIIESDAFRADLQIHPVRVGDRGQECLERRVVPIGWGAVHGGEKELFQAVLVRDEGYARRLEPVAEHVVTIRMGVYNAVTGAFVSFLIAASTCATDAESCFESMSSTSFWPRYAPVFAPRPPVNI